MAEAKKVYVAVHALEGGKDQFTVGEAKVSSVKPGAEFTTDAKTAAELVGLGAARLKGDAAPEAPSAPGPSVTPTPGTGDAPATGAPSKDGTGL